MKALSLLLAVIHAVSALILLIFSAWFIAACAIAGVSYAVVSFNYLLPAVIIRALALTRIVSGYSQMWTGHHALLSRLKSLRSQLFARLRDQQIQRRAEGTEALASHSETIARVTMAWTAHQLSLIAIFIFASLAIYHYLPNWLGLWLIFMVAITVILLIGLRLITDHSTQLASAKTQFRHQSEHHLQSAALWHLSAQIIHPNMQTIQRLSLQQHNIGEYLLWWSQLVALSLLLYALNTGEYRGQAVAMILILLLLAAKDWLAPTLRAQTALSDYRHSRHTIKQLPLHTIPSAQSQPQNLHMLQLESFKASNRPIKPIDLSLKKGELILLQGDSGSGKTSLLKAIVGLLPHSGAKIVDGQSLDSGLLERWHYAEQSPVVLSASLADNLRLANPNATESQLRQALEFADLAHLSDLSEWLGEQGRRLSGGELKRLTLARAYLMPAQLYLFDEPFEGLNIDKQQHIAHSLQSLQSHAPVIVASHIVPDNLIIDQCLILST